MYIGIRFKPNTTIMKSPDLNPIPIIEMRDISISRCYNVLVGILSMTKFNVKVFIR